MASKSNKIITVGFCPAWDVTNYVDGIEWGQHKVISSQTIVPAGKSLNISKALAWMSTKSIAAGLWGGSDYEQLIDNLSDFRDYIDIRFTVVEGGTRRNITIVDTKENKEIHLRAKSDLATLGNINKLKSDLDEIIEAGSTVIFASSMPEGPMLNTCLSMIKNAIAKGANVVIDTSGYALVRIVELDNLYMIKPNMEELSQLFGEAFNNDITSIVNRAKSLCDRVQIVLVSLGKNGALAITKDKAFYCRAKPSGHKVVNTVSCGDYLVAGFISEDDGDLCKRLETAVKLATARAFGFLGKNKYSEIINEIEVELKQL